MSYQTSLYQHNYVAPGCVGPGGLNRTSYVQDQYMDPMMQAQVVGECLAGTTNKDSSCLVAAKLVASIASFVIFLGGFALLMVGGLSNDKREIIPGAIMAGLGGFSMAYNIFRMCCCPRPETTMKWPCQCCVPEEECLC